MKLTRWLPFIFFLSGFSALIYQVVWQRLLTLYYGVGAVSIVLIVSIYMMGLGIGALLGGCLAERIPKRMFCYFLIEFFVGGFGLFSLNFLAFIGVRTAGSSYSLGASTIFLFLLIPTTLMGMTLPLLTKIFNSAIKNFFNTVSTLYFINTLGAAAGALGASYMIISFWGLDAAVYSAAAINFGLAIFILFLGKEEAAKIEPLYPSERVSESRPWPKFLIYFLAMGTGFLAIGYEIIWYRVVGILVKSSPYAFSTILAVYLMGIAIGSWCIRKFLNRYPTADRKNLFFILQFLVGTIVLSTFLSYYFLTKHTPFGTLTQQSFMMDPHPFIFVFLTDWTVNLKRILLGVYALLDVFWWAAFFVFIPAILMGASFPLLAAFVPGHEKQEGYAVGIVYFFNIMGNVLGGLLTGLVLLPVWGTTRVVAAYGLVGIFLGIFVARLGKRVLPILVRAASVICLSILAVLFFPSQTSFYRTMHPIAQQDHLQWTLEEGIEGIVGMYYNGQHVFNYINGTLHGGRPGFRFYAQTLEALSMASGAQKVLVIGYGTGSTVEIILKMENVTHVTVVEINEALLRNLRKVSLFDQMLADARLTLIIDDGRRFLLRDREQYDLILIDPLRTTAAYSNNLYSKEFFELIKQHLSPRGVFMVWTDEGTVLPKTVATVFPHVRLYLRYDSGFCLAALQPFRSEEGPILKILTQFSQPERDAIIHSASYFYADEVRILAQAETYPINRDLRPVSEYYIGMFFKSKYLYSR